MNPFVCQKCGKPLHGHSFLQCVIDQRDQLQAWKESAMTVERQWDPNQLAAMLGGQLGEPQRAVIQREVPRLVERVKQLEAVLTDPHALWANWLRGTVKLPDGIGDIRECAEKMKRFRSRWLAVHQELRNAEDRVERAEERVSRLEIAGDTLATVTIRNGRSHEQWHEAKSQP